ncbi:hypothetical protein GJA_1233 [Janthinobacterium agaricidamnosum NBRC 102515 = DSM 9628]|uniref:Uncharacterized protein n=1 Tax=Janthinobacterium agaricidamnosum NBRC 102515 = DSM 9628 TaxID=1349767 RepID=W0V1Z3_9BURK|nr:hypothetical protein GJA_1233 [Janthinobacterium agaricidamnosum NBRC 102515 = DSM 9628]
MGRAGLSVDTQQRIEVLMLQLKDLSKKSMQTRKQMMETADPATREVLMKALSELQDVERMVQAQIAQLQQSDQRRQEMREQAQQQEAAQRTNK